MAKSNNQKLKILYIMRMLSEKTDENHTISVADIVTKLQWYDIKAERKSIYDDIETLRTYGMDIEMRREHPQGYFLASRKFELPELKLLVDAVQSSKFITAKKSNELIKKIESLASKFEAQYLQRQVFVSNRIKTMNESIYYSVDKIHVAISANAKIRFQYVEWTVTKETRVRKNGAFYEISPWALNWDDENYYLIGYDDEAKMIKHYRVDKIVKLEVTEEKREGKEYFNKFDTGSYAKRTFGMYGGEEELVKLKCDNYLAGAIIDRFGKDITIRSFDEECFIAIVPVNISAQFYGWVLGLGNGVIIISPHQVVEGFKEHVSAVMANYFNS